MARLTDETKSKILADYHIGKSQNQLAKNYDCSPATVNKLCKGIVSKHRHKYNDFINKPFKDSEDGFLYVLYFRDSAGKYFYKIGLARDLKQRIRNIQTSTPFEIYIAISYYVEDKRKEEKTLHEQFKDSRIMGEWFDLSKKDLLIIKERSLRILTNGI